MNTDPESSDKRPYPVSEYTKLLYRCAQLRAALATAEAERDHLREALTDMRAGWRYIRQQHGDLGGVGWQRCEDAASAALGDAS